MSTAIRLGADIGGTFTDIALDCRGTMFTTKVLTNYAAPEQSILDGIESACAELRSRLAALRAGTGDGPIPPTMIELPGAWLMFTVTRGSR